MKISKIVLAAAALCASVAANATVTGSLGGGYGTFLSLSSAGLDGGTVATIAGGSVYSATVSGSAMPAGTVGNFLSAGVTAGSPATMTFAGGGLNYISFLWGSPDSYNTLTVGTSDGVSTNFLTSTLGLPSTGNQSLLQYVQFTADVGSTITSLKFASTTNAFETANYSTTPVPEPETYALMLAGLGAVGFMARRRRNK